MHDISDDGTWTGIGNIWFLTEDRPKGDVDFPTWFIRKRGHDAYSVYDYALFPVNTFPNLEAAKFGLLIIRAAARG